MNRKNNRMNTAQRVLAPLVALCVLFLAGLTPAASANTVFTGSTCPSWVIEAAQEQLIDPLPSGGFVMAGVLTSLNYKQAWLAAFPGVDGSQAYRVSAVVPGGTLTIHRVFADRTCDGGSTTDLVLNPGLLGGDGAVLYAFQVALASAPVGQVPYVVTVLPCGGTVLGDLNPC